MLWSLDTYFLLRFSSAIRKKGYYTKPRRE